ncbi:uncharacterized protein RCC_00025 [Ramularia collo-cygni]|uniref:Uncharacterized protein n=1 Tax=Ramularia collo-cygni TaxID=112498 RepID=A0A2D3UPX2_9PEZI|nr:uncharacterized protein RCC_00025 [Ramularia collo-cygni]CZT14050.1 uncharacterized protein RCC_00025 [Ramularia collo-cygni]
MTIKHIMAEQEESPRAQKRSSPATSSDISTSYFSAPSTSPTMPGPFNSFPPLHPPLLAMEDVDNGNYTATMATAPTTLQEMENMARSSASAEEHVQSMTPIKSTAGNAGGGDMLQFSPRSAGSLASSTESEYVRRKSQALWGMSKEDRQEEFRALFGAQDEVELQNMRAPEVCKLYPDFADELLQAYLSSTCFTVKVWANYDSVEKLLYDHEERMKSCGKLTLPPKRYKQLEDLDPAIYQFRKVRLDIGTPFRTLFMMHIGVEPSSDARSGWELEVRYHEIDDPRKPHYILRHVVETARQNIQADGVNNGQSGLTFGNLEAIALEFRYKAKNVAEEKQSKDLSGNMNRYEASSSSDAGSPDASSSSSGGCLIYTSGLGG